eukprot:CAMPEP_0206479400 /NCGR_PEP_ID=MMETSP0324_2-20121206/36645_1 /ASSEMBLY_ACC=CAM_ASM_000836 /TAXON_ID=2866 /ORGANISM="Crypthecodinium cohnii, Strain Seligo" /LENGTH=214 /DNA_ID=CAMNT_0053955927 /DNA_START=54 /DNA_END=700 /DNA_ORIENTATION=-
MLLFISTHHHLQGHVSLLTSILLEAAAAPADSNLDIAPVHDSFHVVTVLADEPWDQLETGRIVVRDIKKMQQLHFEGGFFFECGGEGSPRNTWSGLNPAWWVKVWRKAPKSSSELPIKGRAAKSTRAVESSDEDGTCPTSTLKRPPEWEGEKALAIEKRAAVVALVAAATAGIGTVAAAAAAAVAAAAPAQVVGGAVGAIGNPEPVGNAGGVAL